MKATQLLTSAVLGLTAVSTLRAVPNGQAPDSTKSFEKEVLPILKSHCTECHGDRKQKANVNFTAAGSTNQLKANADLWYRMLEQIESGAMPPEGEDVLSQSQRQALVKWVRGSLTPELVSERQREGRSHLRRLSRSEYANTMLDLFGVRPAVNRFLPQDGRVDGYDKVSAALPFSVSGTEGFVKTAEETLNTLFTAPKAADPKTNGTVRLWARPSEQTKGHILELPDDTKVSFNSDLTSGPLAQKREDGSFAGNSVRVPGVHKLRISVYGYQTDKPLPFAIWAGHTGAYPQLVNLVDILEAQPGKPTVIETEVYFRTGPDNDQAPVADSFRLVPLGLGVPVPKNTLASNCKGPGLAVQWVDVIEPELPLAGYRFLTADFSEKERRLLHALPSEVKKAFAAVDLNELRTVLDKTFRRVGARLFRRDLSDAEASRPVQNFLQRLEAGDLPLSIFKEEITKMLTAPDSLAIIEQPGRLNEFALATRLSYLLWNSTPDEELLDLARQRKLSDPRTLRTQTDRMLKDARAERFIKDFPDQWLGIWGIENTTPDKDVYPEYDELLRYSSLHETHATFRRMLTENLSVVDFVAPKWGFINERLARHYGFPTCEGFTLRSVNLPPNTPFGGVWTQPATMKVTANGTNTSPVKRGVWMAERLLGVKIPPPPPTAGSIEPDIRGAKTLREQLALHSSKGSCQACHAKFDPYGFALESFDVIGAFRTTFRMPNPEVIKLPANQRKGLGWMEGLTVDSAGKTPDGRVFSGINELRQFIAQNPAQLAKGVARHLVTYATGEPVGPIDEPAIEAIVNAAAKDRYGLRSIVYAVVESDVFQMK